MLLATLDPVSRRGDWRHTLSIYSPGGGTDPGACVFTINVRPQWQHGWRSDYGWWDDPSLPCAALTVSTADGSGNAVVEAFDSSINLTWLFPSTQIASLRCGACEASVMAVLGDETLELARLSFTVI